MKISSCKAKGRALVTELKEALLAAFPDLTADDLIVTSSSVPGEDLMLSPAARSLIPWTFECKNQEKINIWASWIQALSYSVRRANCKPVLVFRKNRTEPLVAIKLSDFITLIS